MSSGFLSDKIKARHFYSTKRFIRDLCTLNDGEFARFICDIYVRKLELKVVHHVDHAKLLNLDITIKEGTFIYKLFDNRESFPFSIARICHIKSNIPQNIFYLPIKGEFLMISGP